MNLFSIFQMPKPVNVMARTSSITNSFVNGIIPCIPPTESELEECLKILGLDPNDLRCAYCSDKSTEWDHLRPIVKNKKPTGYISDIYNLVPSCGKCNQSKGNKYWKDWISSNARLSPKSRNVKDLDRKVKRLELYETWKQVEPINFEELVDQALWLEHWKNYEKLYELMKQSQVTSSKVQQEIIKNYQVSLKGNNCVRP